MRNIPQSSENNCLAVAVVRLSGRQIQCAVHVRKHRAAGQPDADVAVR